jgi:hypothetical protein
MNGAARRALTGRGQTTVMLGRSPTRRRAPVAESWRGGRLGGGGRVCAARAWSADAADVLASAGSGRESEERGARHAWAGPDECGVGRATDEQ